MKLLASTISPYVHIDEQTGELYLYVVGGFHKLSPSKLANLFPHIQNYKDHFFPQLKAKQENERNLQGLAARFRLRIK